MTTYGNSPSINVARFGSPPFWICLLLGIVLVVAGFLILGDVVLATVVSTLFIGWTSIIAGAFELFHALWTKGWGGFLWQMLLGVLYIAFGVALVTQPVTGAIVLTYVLGLLLLVSGFVRILLGFSRWNDSGWIMLASGIFGILAGLVILTGFPKTGLWVLGFLLAVDLISHGIAWLAYAWQIRVKAA
jgi:uncharacterized membrane protein HdeD (DUF308 family)